MSEYLCIVGEAPTSEMQPALVGRTGRRLARMFGVDSIHQGEQA